MSQVENRTQEQTRNYETESKRNWNDASRAVDDFKTDPLFIESLYEAGITPSDQSSTDYTIALSHFAASYVETRTDDGTLNSELAQRITIVAEAPKFIAAQDELNYYEELRKSRRLDDGEWKYYRDTLKPTVIEYNRLLSDYAYEHPTDEFSTVESAIFNSAAQSHSNTANVESQVTNTLRGARTESVTRQLFDFAGIPYKPGTAESDARGGDLIVIFKGNEIKIDIKSSLIALADKRGGYSDFIEKNVMYSISKRPGEQKKDHVVSLYPGFSDGNLEALGDKLGIENGTEFVNQRTLILMIQLTKAANELGY